jgi:hypothetical protein
MKRDVASCQASAIARCTVLLSVQGADLAQLVWMTQRSAFSATASSTQSQTPLTPARSSNEPLVAVVEFATSAAVLSEMAGRSDAERTRRLSDLAGIR